MDAIAYLPVAFLAAIALMVGLVLLQHAINRVRGFQLVTLKTKMYWENGKAVAGEKVKTWRIAVPYSITLRGNWDTWSIYTFWPRVYSDRREDIGSDRFVRTLTQLNAQEEIIAYTPGLGGPEFILRFTNMIPYSNPGPRGDNKTYFRSPEASANCISQNASIDYHGWVVSISPSDLSSERKCAIVGGTLDRWTVHIDDILSKDSGQ
jgi:hypothetical protein